VARRLKNTIAGLAALIFAFVGGFLVFASFIARPSDNPSAVADGIVVMTGGQHRLAEGARLLAEGRGSRLLVSGVNRMVSREDIHRASALDARLFERVDVGYEALDTIGNAEETRDWARARGFRRLIVVTSTYHMPRTLVELRRAMPEAGFIPHRVMTAKFQSQRWWQNLGTARLLLSEYIKIIPSAARLGVARLSRMLEGHVMAWGSVPTTGHA
jgi:uncharacterized SAM-binding protein YcdF (DUF218 family)